jgi:hypothetical protein
MIPATYHFNNIDRCAALHPGVEAEIAEARRRDGTKARRTRLQALSSGLGRLLRVRQPEQNWSRVPAE